MARFTMHTDPGHGWLAVTEKDLNDIGLNPRSFSRYSYRHGEWLYLEEDCDASKFIQAYAASHGEYPSIADSHSNRDSVIRSYARLI